MTFIPLLIIIIDESVSIKYPVHCYIQPNDHIRSFLDYFVLRRNIFALSLRKLMIAKKHHRIPRDHRTLNTNEVYRWMAMRCCCCVSTSFLTVLRSLSANLHRSSNMGSSVCLTCLFSFLDSRCYCSSSLT
jgi:hypothetical protein